MQVLTSV